MFVDGAFNGNLLFAGGYSNSKDLGYSFAFGNSDAVFMVINVTTDTIQTLKHLGFGGGNETLY